MTQAGPASAAQHVSDPCAGALQDDLGWALGVLFRSYAKAAAAAVSDVPGGPRGYQVLRAAADSAPGSQQELAHHLGVDRTVMTYLLDDLEQAGLIERRPDPADRRARRVVATPEGRDRLTDLDARLRAAEQHVLGGLAAGPEQDQFRALLQRLAAHASTFDPAPAPIPSACGLAEEIKEITGDGQ